MIDRAAGVARAVERAAAVLDVLVAEPSGLGLSETARRAALSKATVLRLLASLQRAGLVVRDPISNLYRPGIKLVWMGEQVLRSHDLLSVAQPHIRALAQTVGHGVLTGVLHGANVVYIDHVEGSAGIRVHHQLGEQRSVHISSIGKAILAHLPTAQIDAVLAACPFDRHTPYTITSAEVLRAELATIRRQGWASLRDEHLVGAASFSAPVFDHSERVVGGIGLTGPSVMFGGATLEQDLGYLLAAARATSSMLGYRGSLPVSAPRVDTQTPDPYPERSSAC